MTQPKISQDVQNIAFRIQQLLDQGKHQNTRIGLNIIAERGTPRHVIVDVTTLEPKAADVNFILSLLGASPNMGLQIVVNSAGSEELAPKP